MRNVVIKGASNARNYSRRVRLNNGMVLIHRDVYNRVLGVYMVTSFRNDKDNPTKWRNTAFYCSLINLDNGTIAFEEACTRDTTELRVLRHLCRCGCYSLGQSDFNDEKISGSYIEEVPLHEYTIYLDLHKGEANCER